MKIGPLFAEVIAEIEVA